MVMHAWAPHSFPSLPNQLTSSCKYHHQQEQWLRYDKTITGRFGAAVAGNGSSSVDSPPGKNDVDAAVVDDVVDPFFALLAAVVVDDARRSLAEGALGSSIRPRRSSRSLSKAFCKTTIVRHHRSCDVVSRVLNQPLS
jgi:hypothetical protein